MHRITLIIILLFYLNISYSQLINIENLRKESKQGWQGSISGNFQFTQNTKTISSFSGDWALQSTQKRHTFLFFGGFSMLKIDTLSKLINGGFEHFRYNYTFTEKGTVTFEIFIQHQFNYIKYLRKRIINGYGPRIRLIDKPGFKLYLAPLIMYEHEIYADDQNTKTDQLKGDFILSFHTLLNPKVTLTHVTYYQPKIDYWKDYRISTQTGIQYELVKNLKLGLSIDLSYDAMPPIKNDILINKLFYSTQNFLSFTF